MDGHKISEAARATGFTVSALRFYEQVGVVVPDRTATGYRSYRTHHLESLRFVARGKQLGLNLDEISELLALLVEEYCEPVQSRIRQLVTDRIGLAQEQIGQLAAFAAQLQVAATRLDEHTPDGACDSGCGCRSDPEPALPPAAKRPTPRGPDGSSGIACTLDPHLVEGRIDQWNRVLASASGRRKTASDGTRFDFESGIDVAALAGLAAAEHACCGIEFEIGIGSDKVSLTVTGPDDADDLLTALFGAAV